jgi:hypothetical protein
MGSTRALKLKKPNEGMFGTFKGKPKELLKEFKTAQSEKGELEGSKSIRKKYNIKSKYTYPRAKALLAKKQKQKEKNKLNEEMTLGKPTLLGS